MSLRNKKDFREAVLQALDVTDDKDVENEYNFKSAVLEAMGVEFVPADLRDFEICRAKLVEGIGNMSGGGSSDFSTAEVTFLFTGLPEGVTPFLYNPYLGINIGTDDNPEIWAIPEYGSRSYGDGICTTILYKGTALMTAGVASVTGSDNNFYVRDYENPVTLSGAIEEDGDDFIITGDCSITVPLVAE